MLALKIFVPGAYEDAFIYMNNIVAVTTDRALLRANWTSVIDAAVPRTLRTFAKLWFERNDLLLSDGVGLLLADPVMRSAAENIFTRGAAAFLSAPVEWTASSDYDDLIGDGTVLDLQIYAQRLFVGTTRGVLHADLVGDADEFFFARATKRTDARCNSLSIRYGAVAASCEDAGLLMSFDEFGELRAAYPELHPAASSSQRTSWLGYNLVNYRNANHAEGLRARYDSRYLRSERRRDVVLTDVTVDDSLIAAEQATWDGADFVFNDHARFFVHAPDGTFEVHDRAWNSGRLGAVVASWSGTLSRPLSAVPVGKSLAIETYGGVSLLGDREVHSLYDGEAIVVRSFPNSIRYKNLIVVVDADGINIISPLL